MTPVLICRLIILPKLLCRSCAPRNGCFPIKTPFSLLSFSAVLIVNPHGLSLCFLGSLFRFVLSLHLVCRRWSWVRDQPRRRGYRQRVPSTGKGIMSAHVGARTTSKTMRECCTLMTPSWTTWRQERALVASLCGGACAGARVKPCACRVGSAAEVACGPAGYTGYRAYRRAAFACAGRPR